VEPVKIDDIEDFKDLVYWLREQGCDPSVYERGKLQRFHVDRYGNFWEDHIELFKAAEIDTNNWIEKGMPK